METDVSQRSSFNRVVQKTAGPCHRASRIAHGGRDWVRLSATTLLAALAMGAAPRAEAACYTGPFPFTNDTDITCIVVRNTSFTGDVVNSTTGVLFSGTFGNGVVVGTSNITGGISNAGLISGASNGIVVQSDSALTGGIVNSGTISVGRHGIAVRGDSTVSGSITNSGTISGDRGIIINSGGFTGGIINTGKISATVQSGIAIFDPQVHRGGVVDFGRISGNIGIDLRGGIAVFDSGTITGTSGTAINFGSGAPNTLTLGARFVTNGNVLGSGRGIFQLGGTGTRAFNLGTIGTQYSGFSTYNVIGGNWVATGTNSDNWTIQSGTLQLATSGSITGNITVNAGNAGGFNRGICFHVGLGCKGPAGTLTGTGTVGNLQINSGATFAPGTGTPGTSMTVAGNLAFQSGALYFITVNGMNASKSNVSSTASLAGTVQVNVAPGIASPKNYDVLHSADLNGTKFDTPVISSPNFKGSLSYTTTDVLLTITADLGAGTNLNQNQHSVANPITNFFNSGSALPPRFSSLFNLSGATLGNALTQLAGEAATGAERAAIQLTNEFLQLMLDPFVNGRGSVDGLGGSAMGFAPDEQTNLPAEIALAYASILNKAPTKPAFEQRWTAWGSAYGGSNQANGDTVIGSNNVTASTFGFAGGMDYHVSPSTVVGFALAGAGTSWGLANALGTGRSDAFQVGGYTISWLGPAYVAGALALSNHWFTTNRSALGDALMGNFVGQSYGARFESGYRYAVLPAFGVTPYGAVQAQAFHTPAYSETDVTGGGSGLTYAAMNTTDVRGELGARFDDPTLLYGRPLILFGRLAWAHDLVSDPSLRATFESLTGSRFTVNGAPIPQNSALLSAGAKLYLAPHWALIAKFDGEFANGSQTYAGTGMLRYTW